MNDQPTTPQPMTDNNHPITPPRELVAKWITEGRRQGYFGRGLAELVQGRSYYVATQSARWGYKQRGTDIEAELQKARDEELEACCEWLDFHYPYVGITQLRAARRPKPPTLGEQAQRILVENGTTIDGRMELDPDDIDTIRAALKRLQELEALDD